MADQNPYESPNRESNTLLVTRPIRAPYACSVILLCIGGGFLLLLNGQVFTNTLVFLGFAAVSGMTWIRYIMRSSQEQDARLGIYLLFAHAAVLIGFASGLPGKYRAQQEFNQRMNDAVERARHVAD